MPFTLNERLQTPQGPGLFQGQVKTPGAEPQAIVAHTPRISGEWVRSQADYAGFWVLRMYPMSQVTKVS